VRFPSYKREQLCDGTTCTLAGVASGLRRLIYFGFIH
jgi:hypothetical protein